MQKIMNMVAQATDEINNISVEQAKQLVSSDDYVFVDIRDIRELYREGTIPGSYHAPRGMLEFWFAPDSPYFKPALGDTNKTYVLYCAAASRSALSAKTLQDMGMSNIAQLAGGFGAWKKLAGEIQSVEPKSKT